MQDARERRVKRARLESPTPEIELSTSMSTLQLQWQLAESSDDEERVFYYYLLYVTSISMIYAYVEPDMLQFFPPWVDVDEVIPEGYAEKQITWPLCGYIPATPEIILGMERRWPHLPWPELRNSDSMEVDESKSRSFFSMFLMFRCLTTFSVLVEGLLLEHPPEVADDDMQIDKHRQ